MMQFSVQKNASLVSLAPMMGLTCPHGRYLMRLLAPHLRLYSEMLVDRAILHGPVQRLLACDPIEAPLAFQLASANPETLARAIRRLHEHCPGEVVQEINLNVGCPSARVQAGGFGVALMKDPSLLGALVAAMHDASQVPISVKLRLGVDNCVGTDMIHRLIERLSDNGCRHVIVHARRAWLKGLDPKQNRHRPPLDYAAVYDLKHSFPDIRIVLNGGLQTIGQCRRQLAHVDGVMIGRAAFDNPWLMAGIEQSLFGTDVPTLAQLLDRLIPYWSRVLDEGAAPVTVFRGAFHLIHGVDGARGWRSLLGRASQTSQPDLEEIRRYADRITGLAA